MYKTSEKQLGQNRRQNCKKLAEWNRVYIQKSEMKTNTKTKTEENEIKVG